jgi:hypothetical protein
MNDVIVVGWLLAIAANFACCVICFEKGKPWFGALGFFVAGPFAWIGAIRLAKPGSRWYRRRYEHEPWKQEESRRRFDTPPARIREKVAERQSQLEAENAALKAQLADPS